MGHDIDSLYWKEIPLIIKKIEKFNLILPCRIVMLVACCCTGFAVLGSFVGGSAICPLCGANGIEKRKYRKGRHKVNWSWEVGFFCYGSKGAQ